MGGPPTRQLVLPRALAPTRELVAKHLAEASQSPTRTADLGVIPGLADEVARNLVLETAPATPAAEVYTGVLYDALDLASMDASARRRANQWLVVVSALHGARATQGQDHGIPAVDGRHASPGSDRGGAGDRSSTTCCPRSPGARSSSTAARRYAVAWTPTGEDLADRWVQVRVPGASHMAKHTRGLVARHLCVGGSAGPHAPARRRRRRGVRRRPPPAGATGAPWVLDVTAR